MSRYKEDPEYRQRKIEAVKERHRKLKEQGLDRRAVQKSRAQSGKSLPLKQCEGCGRMFSPMSEGKFTCARCTGR